MKSHELNQLIRSFHRNVLIVTEPIDARDEPVIVPAGVEIHLLLLGKVTGTVNVGGYSVSKAPKADFARPLKDPVEVRADGGDKRERGGFVRLANERMDPTAYQITEFGVPIAWGVHLTVRQIDADGRAAGLHIDRAVSSSFDAHVVGARVVGTNLKHCRNSRITGSARSIGVPGQTGQGYGLQVIESRGCSVIGYHGEHCRYIVSLTGGGMDNEVAEVSGFGTESECDIHGGGEVNPHFRRAGRVKVFNEAWRMPAVGVRHENCAFIATNEAEFLELKRLRAGAA